MNDRWRKWALLTAGMVLGGLFGYAGAWLFDSSRSGDDAIGWLLAILVLAGLPLVILVHELGHIAAGLAKRFRFSMLVLGPLRLESGPGGLRLRMNRSLALAGGLTIMLPDGPDRLRTRMAWLVAGGPLASLLLGVGLLATPGLVGGTGALAETFRLTLTALGIGSLFIFLATMVPARSGGIDTDGRHLFRLLRNDARGVAATALLMITALARSGKRPRDWPPELIDQVLALADGSETEALGRQLAAASAVDRGQTDAARAHIERGIELAHVLAKQVRPGIYWEAATFFALHVGDADRARDLLEQSGQSSIMGTSGRVRAEAAVLAVEGRGEEALERLEAARSALLDEEEDAMGLVAEELEMIRRLADAGLGKARVVAV